jgi:Mg2+-importing ATPase
VTNLANDEIGLTSKEAARRLADAGPNEPAPHRTRSGATQLLALFLNPLVVILLIAALASGMMGQFVEAGIIATVVLCGIVINFIQTWRSQNAADALRAQVAPTANVKRDGEWREVHRADVVPGDLIRLSAGDLVPADARLVQARDLYVQQSALTGESAATAKDAGEAAGAEANQDASTGPGNPRLVFLGTSVVSGTATARVLTTGPATMFGDIAQRLVTRPEETAFELGIRQFGQLITRTIFFLVLFIVVVRLALHREALESLLFAIALAVGLTPEFLPMITSVTLARGAVRMAHVYVIVKQLAAIQNLGSIDILCSDKTGTLTTGNMKLERSVDPFGTPSDETLRLAWLNSKFETGLRSPLNVAIRDAAGRFADGGYEKVDEVPFDFERRCSSIIVSRASSSDQTGAAAAEDEWLLITKGAPESILTMSSNFRAGSEVRPLTDEIRSHCRAQYEALSAEGLRVLAVAFHSAGNRAMSSKADERDLTLAGFLTFYDPPVEDAAEVVAALREDGVQIKILTGDNELVTRHICRKVGLDDSGVVLGSEIQEMTDTALEHVVENAHVFARVSPGQKTRILLALKHRGHAVGFMGDGINDAPTLRAADVGISVASAVDVAREAAAIILVKPGLRVLHQGILEGRRAAGNVTKYLLMGTSSNFGNMFSMAVASLFLPFLPMLPAQILLNNFLYDMAQVTIPTDNVDEEYLRSPQRWDISLVRKFMVLIGPISSVFDLLTFWVLLRWFHAGEELFHTGWFVESLATQTLVLFVIRTMKRPWTSRPSRALTLTTLGIVAVGMLLPASPLAAPLGFTPLPAGYFFFLVSATATYLTLVELAKQRLFRTAFAQPAETR